MRHYYRQFNKVVILLVLSGFISLAAKAQGALVQKALAKLESCSSYSYRSVTKIKEYYTTDTVTEQHQALFETAPADRQLGYLFSISTQNEQDKTAYTQLYNGQNLVRLTPQDSTYQLDDIKHFTTQTTLAGSLKWILERLKRKSSGIIKTKDTTIDARGNYHLIATVYDTLINNERNYNVVNLFMDKASGLPTLMIIRARYTTFGNGVSYYYSSARYHDLTLRQDTQKRIATAIPAGYHLPKAAPVQAAEQSAPLQAGSVAPDWTLVDTEGKTVSLAQLKGQVVLIDFFFIGCGGCMEALKPLDALYNKYKNQQVTQLSITIRDSREASLKFKRNYHIQSPIYLNGAAVAKSYHVAGYPTFCFIDKDGKIASVITGYSDDFETKAAATLDRLLKQ